MIVGLVNGIDGPCFGSEGMNARVSWRHMFILKQRSNYLKKLYLLLMSRGSDTLKSLSQVVVVVLVSTENISF